eukprot:9483340-Pyramimonas_sp.AAC.1
MHAFYWLEKESALHKAMLKRNMPDRFDPECRRSAVQQLVHYKSHQISRCALERPMGARAPRERD